MNLFDKKITLTYDEERHEYFPPGDQLTSVKEQSLTMYADNEKIFQGLDLLYEYDERHSIIEQLSDMALAAINGEYEDTIGFNDDDEGQDISFIKAGRVLQLSEGVLHNAVYYIYPNQLVNAIVELLEQRAAKKQSSGKLADIKQLLHQNERLTAEDDPLFSLDLQFISDYRTVDRLKIQWGDSFFYTDTVFTNIVEKLLNTAISLLEKNNPDILIEIADYNDDNPLSGEEKSEYYRSFFIGIRPFKQNTSVLDIRIQEDPWPEEGLVVPVDEFIAAVNTMLVNILAHYTVAEFNTIHSTYYDKEIAFPADSYVKFQQLITKE
jgi:hypothetical protein